MCKCFLVAKIDSAAYVHVQLISHVAAIKINVCMDMCFSITFFSLHCCCFLRVCMESVAESRVDASCLHQFGNELGSKVCRVEYNTVKGSVHTQYVVRAGITGHGPMMLV